VLGWFRRRFQYWTLRKPDRATVGFLLPLLGIAAVLLGIGLYWEQSGLPAMVSTLLLVVFLLGLLSVLAGLLAVFGVPMPRVLLPRWYRIQTGAGPNPGPAKGEASDGTQEH
jgi:polyferredoxin